MNMEFDFPTTRLSFTVFALMAYCTASTTSTPAANSIPIDFEREIRPILAKHCVLCHGKKRQEGGLRLDRRDDALRGGDSGKVVIARDSTNSPLVKRLTSSNVSRRMPLDRPPLKSSQIKLLKAWIAAGANWPVDTSRQDLASDHWSFQPIRRPVVPLTSRSDRLIRPQARTDSAIRPTQWVRNPVDAFILARLNAAGVRPSPRADRPKLVRRLHLDLTGLPPEPQVVDAFLADHRPDAYERLVDRLLASPHFGERWGQYWLDLARYADSDGYEMDHPRPNAWRWRDWVIQAINADMPFDQFTVEQLAGDLLPRATDEQKLATGFHRNTLTNRENGIDKEEFRVKAVVDRINTTGTVWLGLTIQCVECHSHKYDPIRQHEYYRMFAFFNDRVDEADLAVAPTQKELAAFKKTAAKHATKVQEIQAALKSAASADRGPIEKRLKDLQKKAPQLNPVAHVFASFEKPRQTHVHVRGNFLDRGAAVSPGVPQVLPRLANSDSPPDRLDLARWLVDEQNPLTARVEANRLWQYLFGVGLVHTPNDFGTQGQPPTHPKLLDWLASELVLQGWSRKRLIRLIVTSESYRQDSAQRPELSRLDPTNRLNARQNRFRMDAELVRDQYLAAGGLLNCRVGGPSFYPPLPEGFSQLGFRVNWRADPLPEQFRRGIYLVVRRNLAYPMFTTFDRPDANVTCTRRERSNTPLQSLTQLNDSLVVASARALAIQIIGRKDQSDRLQFVFRRCLGRRPTSDEEKSLSALQVRLLAIYSADPQSAIKLMGGRERETTECVRLAAWTVLVRTIMNLDEFVTRE